MLNQPDRLSHCAADRSLPHTRNSAMNKQDIADYYDRNTRVFLRIGASSGALALHRGLWDAETANAAAAADAVHTLLAEEAVHRLGSAPRRILDLGCGVGGSVFALLDRFPDATALGVTLSAAQVELARSHAAARQLSARARFLQADFESLDGLVSEASDFDLVIAIESLAHADAVGAVFDAAQRMMDARRSLLLIVDDTLTPGTLTPEQDREVARFRAGWRLPGLCTADALITHARSAGLDVCMNRNLTTRIRTRRLRDLAVRVVAPVLHGLGIKHPFAGNLRGGAALSAALENGAIEYRLLGFHPTPQHPQTDRS